MSGGSRIKGLDGHLSTRSQWRLCTDSPFPTYYSVVPRSRRLSTTEAGELFVQVVRAARRELEFRIRGVGHMHRFAMTDVLNGSGCGAELDDRWFRISHVLVLLSSGFASLGPSRGQSLGDRRGTFKCRVTTHGFRSQVNDPATKHGPQPVFDAECRS